LSYPILKTARLYLNLSVTEGQTDGRTDGQNSSGSYSALHYEQCGRAVMNEMINIYGTFV